MEIRTKKELQYVMKFLGIQFVKVYDKNNYMGGITQDMEYRRGSFCYYNKPFEYLAFQKAMESLGNDYDAIVEWKDKMSKTYTSHLVSRDDGNESLCKGNDYCWKSDFEECGLSTYTDKDGVLVMSGGASGLGVFIQYANDHLMYCNGHSYALDNDEVYRLNRLSDKYGLKTKDCKEYDLYRIGIVD